MNDRTVTTVNSVVPIAFSKYAKMVAACQGRVYSYWFSILFNCPTQTRLCQTACASIGRLPKNPTRDKNLWIVFSDNLACTVIHYSSQVMELTRVK
jgi:hypothetical protein